MKTAVMLIVNVRMACYNVVSFTFVLAGEHLLEGK